MNVESEESNKESGGVSTADTQTCLQGLNIQICRKGKHCSAPKHKAPRPYNSGNHAAPPPLLPTKMALCTDPIHPKAFAPQPPVGLLSGTKFKPNARSAPTKFAKGEPTQRNRFLRLQKAALAERGTLTHCRIEVRTFKPGNPKCKVQVFRLPI